MENKKSEVTTCPLDRYLSGTQRHLGVLHLAELRELVQDRLHVIGQHRVPPTQLVLPKSQHTGDSTHQVRRRDQVNKITHESKPIYLAWLDYKIYFLLGNRLQALVLFGRTMSMETRTFFLETWAWEKMCSSTGVMSGLYRSRRFITHLSYVPETQNIQTDRLKR